MRRYPSPQSPKAVPGKMATFSSRRRRTENSPRRHAELPDAGEDVERTLRLKAGDAHLMQGMQHVPAPLVIGLPHALHILVAISRASTAAYWLVTVGAHMMQYWESRHPLHDPLRVPPYS